MYVCTYRLKGGYHLQRFNVNHRMRITLFNLPPCFSEASLIACNSVRVSCWITRDYFGPQSPPQPRWNENSILVLQTDDLRQTMADR